MFMEKSIKLISLYSKVCVLYNQALAPFIQRFSNNGHLGYISDAELITIYLFSLQEEKKWRKNDRINISKIIGLLGSYFAFLSSHTSTDWAIFSPFN